MSATPTIIVIDCATGEAVERAMTSAEQAALTAVQQAATQQLATLAAIQQAQQADVTSRATLVQQAVAAYQQLQSDIGAWSGMTTTQKLDAVLRTMQALALAMQAEKLIAQIMQRQGN